MGRFLPGSFAAAPTHTDIQGLFSAPDFSHLFTSASTVSARNKP
jgi:hypothetical protein